jgi:hypothetical protein
MWRAMSMERREGAANLVGVHERGETGEQLVGCALRAFAECVGQLLEVLLRFAVGFVPHRNPVTRLSNATLRQTRTAHAHSHMQHTTTHTLIRRKR